MSKATVQKYFVRSVLPSYNGSTVSHGQVIELAGNPNDEKLIRLGIIAEYAGETVVCAECGAEFMSDSARARHGDKVHSPRFLPVDPEALDALEDAEAREDERIARENPLFLENALGVTDSGALLQSLKG